MKNFETVLPEGYTAAKTVDAKNKRVIVRLSLAAAAVTALGIALAVLILRPTDFFENFSIVKYFAALLILLAYIVLHELTHGAAYKILTKQKLTFGFSLTVAFCGVPEIYVYRRTALITLLAPFAVFSLVFGGAALLLPDVWDKTYAAALLAIHAGGCVGDLYDALLFFFKYRAPDTLMNDTGPKQTIYVKSNKS